MGIKKTFEIVLMTMIKSMNLIFYMYIDLTEDFNI